jgi:hypothetical protein
MRGRYTHLELERITSHDRAVDQVQAQRVCAILVDHLRDGNRDRAVQAQETWSAMSSQLLVSVPVQAARREKLGKSAFSLTRETTTR